ncbi:MAG: NAD(P)-dependent alcohol dehydrogenase [Phycisphaerae bacterium]|nr:NAD(P)-dependent alcohol dehydrogenase [Phycisphaerae bacterium]
MKAAVLSGRRVMKIQERPKPKPAPGEVLVRVRSVGVCGSDVHYYAEGKIGKNVVAEPIVLGHEASGDIAEVGAEVKGLAVGQRVALDPGLSCGSCQACRIGRPNLCQNVKFYATPPVDGTLQEFVVAHPDQVLPIPDEMSYDTAAMLEPLQNSLRALMLVPTCPGDYVAVFGCGVIGLACIQLAKAAGATRILGVDMLEYRIETARELGATRVVNAKTGDPVVAGLDMTGGRGVDKVYECTGYAITQGAQMSAIGARMAVVGIPAREVALDFQAIRRRELDIQFTRRFCGTGQRAIELVASEKVNVSRWITHTYALDDVAEAFETVADYRDNVLKAVVNL